jgi:hypothetical protein
MPAWLVRGWRGWAANSIVERERGSFRHAVHQSEADRHVSSFNVWLSGSTLLRVFWDRVYLIIQVSE